MVSRQEIALLLRQDLPRDVLVDAQANYEASFDAAGKAVRGLDLSARRTARSAGFVRSQLVEEGFQRLHDLHGGVLLPQGLIPGTEHRVFQPYGQYGETLLGFGTAPEPGGLPKQNLTRGRTASLNRQLAPELPFGEAPVCATISRCALIVACRDPAVLTKPDEIAIAVISPSYDRFLFHERLDLFLLGYGAPDDAVEQDPEAPLVGLRLRAERRKAGGTDEA